MNRSNTAVELRVAVADLPLEPEQRSLLEQRLAHRITNAGELPVEASGSRSPAAQSAHGGGAPRRARRRGDRARDGAHRHASVTQGASTGPRRARARAAADGRAALVARRARLMMELGLYTFAEVTPGAQPGTTRARRSACET